MERLLEQQAWITVYRLPIKVNKFPFSVCSEQTALPF
jgi:hypothetical protein